MLTTANQSYDAFSVARTELRWSDVVLRWCFDGSVWRAAEAGRYGLNKFGA